MTNGLVVMTPTSIAYSGTSASINADGSVVFSACSSLSLNGVFTGDYDNYMVTVRVGAGSSNSYNVTVRLRTSGTDASGTNYTWQWLQATGTTVNGTRTTSATETRVGLYTESSKYQGSTFYVFGPQLAQPTALRGVSAGAYLNAYLNDYASTHSLSTSYDGLTFIPEASSTFGGLVTVFGFNQ